MADVLARWHVGGSGGGVMSQLLLRRRRRRVSDGAVAALAAYSWHAVVGNLGWPPADVAAAAIAIQCIAYAHL